MSTPSRALQAIAVVLLFAGAGSGSWSETFSDGGYDLTTWQFLSYPQLAGTYTQTLVPEADGNGYLAVRETSSVSKGGAAFGVGLGSDEVFADVRMGATVNVAGDASHNHHGLGVRMTYFISDGTATPAPGLVASGYVMHINWENGPANLALDIEKVVNLQNIMKTDFDVVVPTLDNARSFYAELEAVGAGPVYVTGRLYEYQGGPLVAQTRTMVDTNGNDPWEDANERDEVFKTGMSGIFAQNENSEPAGFYTTFDDVSSVSDGPSAVAISPADGATEVSVLAKLRWVEGAFATGRQLWFGPAGAMQAVDPAPTGATHDPGKLQSGQTYEWRVDQMGPSGTVNGHTWRFTTGDSATVEDFEDYTGSDAIAAAWVHNIGPDFSYVFLDTGTVQQGAKAMRLECQNQYEPFLTEATRRFEQPQDWTVTNPTALVLSFRGQRDNLEQPIYVRIRDVAGNEATVAHPLEYAVQSEPWRTWEIPLSEFAGVDLATIDALTIGIGDGETSGQPGDDRDTLYIDNVRLRASASTR
ncbi:MAG: hypothetical protein GXY19_08650 [Phycisphaerae bacterium]|nr:hypothetical protein [Phycisphaerae bacterium]